MDKTNLGEIGGSIQAPAPRLSGVKEVGIGLHLTLCWTVGSLSLAGNDVGPVDISNPVHPAVAGDWSDLSLEISRSNGRQIRVWSANGSLAGITDQAIRSEACVDSGSQRGGVFGGAAGHRCPIGG